ncbi:hypothetical protein GN956_G5335 [Arapaima gigas]
MYSTASIKLTVCGVLWSALCFEAVFVMAALLAPALHFTQPVNGTNIELFSEVIMECSPPREASYPIFVNLGMKEQPLEPLLSYRLTSYSGVIFTLPGTEQYERLFVCWYNVTKTQEVSPPSNFVNLTITSLPVPTVSVQPAIVLIGGNYSVFCTTKTYFYNATFSIYFRNTMASARDAPLEHFGSLNLNGTGVVSTRNFAEENEMREYTCDFEVYYRNRKLKSPPSRPFLVTAEKVSVRLLPVLKGIRCMGKLEVFLQQQWHPVCVPRYLAEATARVACRELGCRTVANVDTRISSFQSPLFQCLGNETRLRDCQIPAGQRSCNGGYNLQVMCTVFTEDVLPSPRLSVNGFSSVSSIHIYEEDPLEVSCPLSASWHGDQEVVIILMMEGESVTSQYVRTASETVVKFTLQSPVSPGVYSCIAKFDNFFQTVYGPVSNTVTVTTGKRPNIAVIVGALVASLIGAGTLVYVCFCRVSEKETH